MLEGCDAGQILVGGALAPYFGEVNQPIYFVAASDLTETDTVKVRVGLIESSASRPVQTNKEREIITLRKNKTPQQKPLGENTATYCFIGEIDWPKMGDGFVVVGDECDEEIVVCNNTHPQTFNPFWIEKYKNFSYFSLEPNNPSSLSYIVTGCQLKRNSDVQGITFIIPGMPLEKEFSKNYAWTPSSSAIINLCFNEIEQRWIIRFDELRIPIFSSACIEGYINLGDGTDTTKLNSNVQSMSDYAILLKDLDYWEKGPYSQPGKKPQKYAFESGILKHENKHFLIDSAHVLFTFNKFFLDLFNNWIFDKSQYYCPEDVLSSKEKSIRIFTSNAVSNCFERYHNLTDWEKKNEELDCDLYASPEYFKIRTRIKNWATNKSW